MTLNLKELEHFEAMLNEKLEALPQEQIRILTEFKNRANHDANMLYQDVDHDYETLKLKCYEDAVSRHQHLSKVKDSILESMEKVYEDNSEQAILKIMEEVMQHGNR